MSKSLDGVLIKKANQQEHYTEEQIQEFLKCTDSDAGPLYFLKKYFYIQHPVQGKLLYSPYEFQENLVNTYHNLGYR